MWIAARWILDRLRGPRSRADDLAALRRRITSMLDARGVPAGELELALELRDLRQKLSAGIGQVSVCARCAKGHPMPHGRWAGGHCCGGRTEDVFTDHEVAALRLSGTTGQRLTVPGGDHAGCAFRGPTGCSLMVPDRPSLCVHYMCHDLKEELRLRGDLAEIRPLAAALGKGREQFAQMREGRGVRDEGGGRART